MIEVSASALLNNLRTYQNLAENQAVCPVLKSNAYGHGLEQVAQVLDTQKLPFFVVDSLYEAQKLKKAGLQTPILILGYTFPENLRKNTPFHYSASDLETAKTMAKLGLPVHLEVDTGMARMGFSVEELPQALRELKDLNLKMEGLFTHLADADHPSDSSYTQMQGDRFKKAIRTVRELGFSPKWIHVNNSAGASVLSIPELNMMRLGIGLYGWAPVEDPRLKSLQPVIKVKSTLIAIRELKKGDSVSYGRTFIAPKDMRIGTLPFGYHEGLPRKLSNTPPFLGRICMNHAMLEVDEQAKIGDEVLIYGDLAEFAKKAETIPYELLVRLSESVRRVVLTER